MTNMRIVSEREFHNAGSPLVGDLLDLVHDLQGRIDKAASEIRCATLGQESYPGALPSTSDITFELKSARRLRRLRKTLLGPDLYSGPGWELLLQLFDSYLLQRRETVGSVTMGAELSGTTALRWLGRLEQDGLIRLSDDQLDGRRRFVLLTDQGVQLMTNYFSGVAPQLVAA